MASAVWSYSEVSLVTDCESLEFVHQRARKWVVLARLLECRIFPHRKKHSRKKRRCAFNTNSNGLSNVTPAGSHFDFGARKDFSGSSGTGTGTIPSLYTTNLFPFVVLTE